MAPKLSADTCRPLRPSWTIFHICSPDCVSAFYDFREMSIVLLAARARVCSAGMVNRQMTSSPQSQGGTITANWPPSLDKLLDRARREAGHDDFGSTQFIPALRKLIESLREKREEFHDKGRTESRTASCASW